MAPQLHNKFVQYNFQGKTDEELFREQTGHLSSALLVADYDPAVTVDKYNLIVNSSLLWPNRGELISGSFMSRTLLRAAYGNTNLVAEDVDIYFKCKDDAVEFLRLNNMFSFDLESDVCGYGSANGIKYNLIWGIEYTSPENLVGRFDIRACAIAFCPNTQTVWAVRGAIDDANAQKIVFNPVPRGVSVRRLVKYVEKGFQIDPHQRLFFAELIRSDLYSSTLELITGYK